LRLRRLAGMPQKWNEFVARVLEMVNRPSKLTALAHG